MATKKTKFSVSKVIINHRLFLKKQLLDITEENIKIMYDELEKYNKFLKYFAFIPKIYSYDITNEYYIIYEYINGTTMKDIRFFDGINNLTFICNLCKLLNQVHLKGIIHCDLKPDNIIIDNNDNIYIIDWNSSKYINEKPTHGTLKYCSYEQLSLMAVDNYFDIYSIGVMLYDLLINDDLFAKLINANEKNNDIDKILEISSKLKDYPRLLDDVFDKIFTRNMNKRYKDLQELINDLTVIIDSLKREKKV